MKECLPFWAWSPEAMWVRPSRQIHHRRHVHALQPPAVQRPGSTPLDAAASIPSSLSAAAEALSEAALQTSSTLFRSMKPAKNPHHNPHHFAAFEISNFRENVVHWSADLQR